jgi:uncharacterized membrane protein (DUF485 family)
MSKEINRADTFGYGLMLATVLLVGAYIFTADEAFTRGQEKTIVKHGCAEYNGKTGDFQWIKEDK